MENYNELENQFNDYYVNIAEKVADRLRSKEFQDRIQKETTIKIDSYLENDFKPFLHNLINEVYNNEQ